jgi:hypothetical protein
MPSNIAPLRERITSSDVVDDRDRELLLQFSDELQFRQSEYSDHRHRKLLQQLALLAGVSERYDADELPDTALADALKNEAATKNLVRWVLPTHWMRTCPTPALCSRCRSAIRARTVFPTPLGPDSRASSAAQSGRVAG